MISRNDGTIENHLVIARASDAYHRLVRERPNLDRSLLDGVEERQSNHARILVEKELGSL
jgi:hypothetical protein